MTYLEYDKAITFISPPYYVFVCLVFEHSVDIVSYRGMAPRCSVEVGLLVQLANLHHSQQLLVKLFIGTKLDDRTYKVAGVARPRTSLVALHVGLLKYTTRRAKTVNSGGSICDPMHKLRNTLKIRRIVGTGYGIDTIGCRRLGQARQRAMVERQPASRMRCCA